MLALFEYFWTEGDWGGGGGPDPPAEVLATHTQLQMWRGLRMLALIPLWLKEVLTW